MAPQTPYTADLAGRDPIEAMAATVRRIEALTASWPPQQFDATYAPGKWSARQILTHLAQTELALGTRARMALATPNYTAQSFDQDSWLAGEYTLSGPEAVQALAAISRMNVALFASLAVVDRQRPFSHPEYGALTVEWLIYQMAGHQIHHLKQLEAIRPLGH